MRGLADGLKSLAQLTSLELKLNGNKIGSEGAKGLRGMA